MTQAEQREEAVFEAALQLPAEQRVAYLDQTCAGDADLRRRVDVLLGAFERAGAFLKQPAGSHAIGGGGQSQGAIGCLPPTEKPGDRIGRYKLLQQIGEGGCGVVYMAEQEEPVRRRVALKVIKLGMDTKSVVARFEAERQALALMDHPNIAKVLDAGATDTGRPYFVMELVRGVRLTDYCDENHLPMPPRLELFIQVCQAIQHAHQKGVIHRDIKPSNILVTVNDGVPVPKVIDFGIAKATTGQPLTDKTIFTAFEQFIGTPAYMSPEQAVMTSLDIDTRSDIYSLGVLLYELLTGKTPFDAKELLRAGFDEMRRTIREKEPARPSTRLSTMLEGELTTTAKRRQTDAPKLIHLVRGDLDWIVMKCLEKDRTRRYETANGLTADIRHHLDNEPIIARPPGNLYRLQKLFLRNRLVFAGAGALATILVLGTVLSTWQAVRATRAEREHAQQRGVAEAAQVQANIARDDAVAEKQRANEQADIAQAVSDFLLEDLLRQTSSDQQAERGFTAEPNLTMKEALNRAAEGIGDKFKGKPLVEASIRQVIGNSYRQTGDCRESLVHLERARALREAHLGPEHPLTLSIMADLARSYSGADQPSEALALAQTTAELRRKVLGPDDQRTLQSMHDLAGCLFLSGQTEKGILLIQETLARQKEKLGLTNRSTLSTMRNLAAAYSRLGQRDKTLTLLEETLALQNQSVGTNDPSTLDTLGKLASVYGSAGQTNKSLQLLRDALARSTAILGRDHPDTLDTMYSLALAYLKAGQYAQALPIFEEALAKRRLKLGSDHRETMDAMNDLAVTYHKAGLLEKSILLYEESLARRKERYGPESSKTLHCMKNLGLAHHKAGHLNKAIELFQAVLDTRRRQSESEPPETIDAMQDLVNAFASSALTNRGPYDQGITLTHEMLGQQRKLWASNTIELSKALLTSGKLLYCFRQYADSEKLMLEAFDRAPRNGATGLKLQRESADYLVGLYEKWNKKEPGTGKTEKAAEWQQKVADIDQALNNSKPVGAEP